MVKRNVLSKSSGGSCCSLSVQLYRKCIMKSACSMHNLQLEDGRCSVCCCQPPLKFCHISSFSHCMRYCGCGKLSWGATASAKLSGKLEPECSSVLILFDRFAEIALLVHAALLAVAVHILHHIALVVFLLDVATWFSTCASSASYRACSCCL